MQAFERTPPPLFPSSPPLPRSPTHAHSQQGDEGRLRGVERRCVASEGEASLIRDHVELRLREVVSDLVRAQRKVPPPKCTHMHTRTRTNRSRITP